MRVNSIQHYIINKNSFRGKSVPEKEQTINQHLRQHLFENSFYQKPEVYKGNLPEEYMNKIIEEFTPPVTRTKLTDEELLNLNNYNIYKIEGTRNSYRGPLKYENSSLLKPMELKRVIYSDDIIDETFVNNTDKISDFIQTLQKDSVYVGCDYGILRTDIALYLNYFLNPSTYYNSKRPSIPKFFGSADFDDLIDLYDKFTPEQKIAMGWTEEFQNASRKEVEEVKNWYENY